MVISEDDANKVLVYLKKQGQANTFKLATELNIDRGKILSIINGLENKGAIEFKSGVAKFLKFHRKEKKAVKKVPSKRFKEKILELQNLPQKIIRRIKIKKIIQKVPVKSRKLEEQAEHIKKQEGEIEELKRKASAPPKVIRKIVVKKVPVKVKEYITKTVIKKIHLPSLPPERSKRTKRRTPKIVKKKTKVKIKRFKFPQFKFMKGIKNIKIPEFVK